MGLFIRFLLAMALAVPAIAMATTEYVLVKTADGDLAATDGGMSTGRPSTNFFIEESNGKCGFKDDGLGGYENDTDYDGTAYGAYVVKIGNNDWTGDRNLEVHVTGEDIGPKMKFSNWTKLSARGTCTLGSSTFDKYSVTCDSCTP
jgi:hypothetical protein